MFRSCARALAVLLVFVAMITAAPAAGAEKAISTADYAGYVCLAEGPFFNSIYLANNALEAPGASTDPTAVRGALLTFADDVRSATEKFRTALAGVGKTKSASVQAATVKAIAKLKAIEKLLVTTKKDVGSLNVSDVNGFGIGLVNVQKDLVKVSNGFQDIGKIKNPKELDRAIKNDPVCQRVQAVNASRGSG